MKKAAIMGVLALGGLAATAAFIQQTSSFDAGLVARASLAPDQARAKALATVPGGRITESEIEEENGRLIYSFEIAGQNGVTDLEIDAITGDVVVDQDDADDDHDDDDDRKTGRSS
jgi:hypothetical protein